jgi:ligand-binding sensor domain-containing protein/signal transduction histidine kinase
MNLRDPNTPLLIKLFLGAVIYAISFNAGFSQVLPLDYDEFNTRHGLSQNLVLSIAQDQRGFMWFGTEDGLNRFDGHEFKVYKHRQDDPASIAGNSIHNLFVDDDGSILIGTNKGLCRLYPENDEVEHFPVDFTDETKLNGAHVSSIKRNADGSTWISYIGSGVDIIRPGKDTIFHYTIHRNDAYQLKSDMVSSIQFMPDGFTLFGTYSGLELINQEGKVMDDVELEKKYPWVDQIDKSVKSLLLSEDQSTLWVGTELNGLYKVDLRADKVHNFTPLNSELGSKGILAISEDSKGNIWVGSDALYKYNQQRNTLNWFNEFGMYVKNHTHAIFEDREQNIWMGTSRLGVRKINQGDSNVRHFHSGQGEGSIISNEILSFNQDDAGQIWIGSGGAGLYKMRDSLPGFEPSPLNDQLSAHTIVCIDKDQKGYFWLGTWDGGMMRYHPLQNSLEIYNPERGNFKGRHVWDIEEDQEGNLWVGTLRDGLFYFSPESGAYEFFNYMPGDSTALVNDDVISLLVDSRNILWAGTGNGLSVRVPGKEGFQNFFKFQDMEQYGLSNNVIHCIYEAPDGKVWLGTKGGGIIIMRVQDGQVLFERIINEHDGLTGNIIASIQEDQQENVWVSTNKGLVHFSYKDFSVQKLSGVLGLKRNDFLPQASFKAWDGRMFFGSSTGFIVFHPDSLNLVPRIPDVWFTTLKIINEDIFPDVLFKGRKVLEKTITETEELRLLHDDYAFTIGFSPLTYNRQNNIHYAYMLENLDKEWQHTTAEKRFVHYTNLTPGEYTLKVKASYDGQHWAEEARSLRIIISPPWWGTFWFRLVVFLFAVMLVYSIYQGRVRFLKSQSTKLESLVALRTAELKNSNKEIQSLLEEVASQHDKIESKNLELQEINEELEAQRDILELKSRELEKAQAKLQEINVSLEQLVDKRTEKLNDALHELESFLYRASHDLRGPISSMLGLLSLARLEENPAIVNNNYTILFSRAVTQLERSLKKLLQKHTIQKAEVDYEVIDQSTLNEMVHNATEEIKVFRKEDFIINIQEGISFETDKKLLFILLLSLLENAFFFTERSFSKQVLLEIKQKGDHAVITVTDSGVGIRKEYKEHIYNMFYRGSELSTGNGLGLYLVKCVLKKLGGSISLQTEEGKFTSFTIFLPAKPVIKETLSAQAEL